MALRPCNRNGCPNLVQKGYCATCALKHSPRAKIEASRPSAAKRGYDRGWQKTREQWFRQYPFCVDPYGEHGARLVVATDLDHIVPHHGNVELFRDRKNLQGLCKECHSRKTATEDSSFARATSFRGGHAAADRRGVTSVDASERQAGQVNAERSVDGFGWRGGGSS